MKIKKKIFFVLLIVLATNSFSQKVCKSLLFLSSKGISQKNDSAIIIENIRRSIWRDSIVVRMGNNSKKIYPNKNVWGYQEYERINGCVVYRNYNHEFYRVRQIGSLIIYSQTIEDILNSTYTFYCFSRTLDSPIYILKWKNIKEQFKDNACFIEKIETETKWYQDYSNLDKENGKYKFVEFYDMCK